MGKVIVVVSGKGGTGKTTTVAAVGSCLAALGHRKLCIDCDAGLRNLDIALGMSEFAVTDFLDVLTNRLDVTDAAHEHPKIKNLFFLSAPQNVIPEDVDADAMAAFIGDVRAMFDYCLIDSPAGIGPGFRLAAAGADTALLVVNGETASLRDGGQVRQALRELSIQDTRLIVNRVSERRLNKIMTTIDEVIDTVGARLLGLVREDEAVFFAAGRDTPLVLYEDKKAAMHFLRIARRLAGEELPIARRKW